MPFSLFDTGAVARALSQIAEQPEDLADAFFERSEEIALPPEGEGPGLRSRREEGFAVRLARGAKSWLAARDGIDGRSFADALRQIARALPAASAPEPSLVTTPWSGPPEAPEILDFPGAVQRAIRAKHAAFPLALEVKRHRRFVLVVGPRLSAAPEKESFYSVTVALPWGARFGALYPELGKAEAEDVASALVERFRARQAPRPKPWSGALVLGPSAVAVLLHEAVAHALEADLLALGGNPDAAVGVELGPARLSVLDDPSAAPLSVRRSTDDEGTPVVRRWLLRDGKVEEPISDVAWSRTSEKLTPGSGRRAHRTALPGPRSTFLELVAGETTTTGLFAAAEGGLWIPEASRGALDPRTGEFSLGFPYARRIYRGELAESLGPCGLSGRVADLLARIVTVGSEVRAGGAGWCAKDGQKLPVWASVPPVAMEGVEVSA